MINTYQTSLPAPPPIPPRMSRSRTGLVPGVASSLGHGKRLPRFVLAVVLVHLLLSVGGFFYFYRKEKKDTFPEAEERAMLQTRGHVSSRPVAHMIVKPLRKPPKPGHLEWNTDHSVTRNINYDNAMWLTVLHPGDYYVYSRVTFSKWNPKTSLVSIIQLRETKKDKAENVMKAFCTLTNHTSSVCTASQMEVLTLKAGNQLSVWVEDLSLVDYDKAATAFGMYKL